MACDKIRAIRIQCMPGTSVFNWPLWTIKTTIAWWPCATENFWTTAVAVTFSNPMSWSTVEKTDSIPGIPRICMWNTLRSWRSRSSVPSSSLDRITSHRTYPIHMWACLCMACRAMSRSIAREWSKTMALIRSGMRLSGFPFGILRCVWSISQFTIRMWSALMTALRSSVYPWLCYNAVSVTAGLFESKACLFGFACLGYRHIYLRAKNNDKTHSTLFVHIDIQNTNKSDDDGVVTTRLWDMHADLSEL